MQAYIQKAFFGISFARSTAKNAVAKGSKATKTKECAAVMVCKANAENKGKPTTTPADVIHSDFNCCVDGLGCFEILNKIKAKTAAMQARAPVRNSGLKPCTATRVAGKEPA